MAEQSPPAVLVEFIAKAIVTHPESIAVRELDDGRVLELETAADDRGRVIGRQGRVAKAMRAVLGASRDGADCRLDIVD
ncbi:MAG: KH domain-containing protein [Myxococcota bacterium]